MKLSLARIILFPCLAALVASGCASRNSATGGGLLLSGGSGSAAYLNALQGGIISRSGMSFGGSDTQRALEAEYRALEAAPGGQPVVWEGRDGKGSVVASAPYQVGTQNCRQYRHTIDASGRQTTVRGAACRNPDGTWTPLT
ncbi:hypothetical protein NOF55_15150 [Rhizobiaceae bacterium BDR2-2]|uniref:Surface antigen n=1 Tax=Ectorhizobium quercum TaxID=2965071 RepID=A0AAE3SVK6_9HYPH|nr:hypothetical protein [Ectorhizobium quercum]MCX8998450.1 hypothetical protein [Ectorhizobium quercum]